MRNTLLILRGIPASGKTTFANQWVAEDVDNRSRVNRDELRETLHRGFHGPNEVAVSKAEHAIISSLLAAGRSVVVDNTNLRARYVRKYMELAYEAGAEIEFRDFEIDREEAARRDTRRGMDGQRWVGKDVIFDMAKKFLRNGFELPERPVLDEEIQTQLYIPDPSRPRALQIDIDGTVAIHNGRSPYDYSRVSEDLPNEDVINLILDLWASDMYDRLVFLSGRPETCREDTQHWLDMWFPSYEYDLYMRPADKLQVNDAVIKVELFDQHVRDRYNVVAVFDDRNRVVRAWRKLGLTCLQVAPGDF